MRQYEQTSMFDTREKNKPQQRLNGGKKDIYEGLVVGDYKVIGETWYRKDRMILWQCQCIYCGKEKKILSYDLRRKNAQCFCECMKGKERPENKEEIIKEYWEKTTYPHNKTIKHDHIPGVAEVKLSDGTIKYNITMGGRQNGRSNRLGRTTTLKEAKDIRLAAEQELAKSIDNHNGKKQEEKFITKENNMGFWEKMKQALKSFFQ